MKISFYSNGAGKYNDTEKDREVTFKWTLTKNEIEIKPDIPNSGTLYYKNIEISSTQFKFEKNDLGFDKDKNKVTFYGVYFYN